MDIIYPLEHFVCFYLCLVICSLVLQVLLFYCNRMLLNMGVLVGQGCSQNQKKEKRYNIFMFLDSKF